MRLPNLYMVSIVLSIFMLMLPSRRSEYSTNASS